jgi:Protein of unknown function (DUF3187)
MPCPDRVTLSLRGKRSPRWFGLLILTIVIIWSCAPLPIALAEEVAPDVEDYVSGGPFPTRDYNPVRLLFLSLPAEDASTLAPGRYQIRLELVESSTSKSQLTPQASATLKFETTRAALDLKYGLPHDMELGIEIPLLYRGSGFLDPFIISIEKAFSDLSPDRISFKRDTFGGYLITRDGTEIISGGNRKIGIGDIVLTGKITLLDESAYRPAVAARMAVKLPTGSFDRAFGSGKPDVGIGIAAQKALGPRWVLYLNQNVVEPIGRFGRSGLPLKPIFTTALIGEFLWTPGFSIVGQFDLYTSPFHGVGVPILDKGTTELVLGFNYHIRPHALWQLFAIENFNWPEGGSADFTLATDVVFRY